MIRIDDDLAEDINAIAKQEHESANTTIEKALELYRDVHYGKKKATFVNDAIMSAVEGVAAGLERRLGNRLAPLLSELAIQQAIMAQEEAVSLDISEADLYEFRRKAVEWLKINQRPLRLEQLLE